MSSKKAYRKSIQKKLARETFWSALARGTTFVLFLLTNIYLARKLGVESFGEWSFLFSILTIVITISYFGVNAASNVFVARNSRTGKLKKIFRDSLLLRTKVSVIGAIVFLGISAYLAKFLGRPNFLILFYVATPFILFKTFVEFYNEIFQGLHRLKYQFFLNLSEFGLNLIFAVIILNMVLSIESIIFAYTISALITVILGSFFFNSFYKTFKKRRKKEFFQRKIFRYSLPLVIISMGSLLMTEIDIIMIGLFSGHAEVGIYSAAKEIVNRLPQIAYALALGTMQVFARLSEKNKRRMRTRFERLIKINSMIYLPITLILIFGGPILIKVFYGPEFSKSALPLMVLAPWVFMASQNVFQNYFINYQQKAWTRAMNYSFAIILNIILNATLIPRYGALGAAVGTTISYTPYFLANRIEVKKALR